MNGSNGKCPICGKDNGCAFNTGNDPRSCWCMRGKIPLELREKARLLVSEKEAEKSCICKECVDQYYRERNL